MALHRLATASILIALCSATVALAQHSQQATDSTKTDPRESPAEQQEWRAPAPRGLSLHGDFTPFLTSLSARKRGNDAFALRVAYDILPWLGAGIRISTGAQYVDSTRLGPTAGNLELGGASLEVILHPIESNTLRPFISVSYGLYTILDGRNGYNGSGTGIDFGEELRLTSDFSLSGALSYGHRSYAERIDDGSSTHLETSITENLLGLALGATIYFNLHP